MACYSLAMAAVRKPRKLERNVASARLQAEEMIDALSHRPSQVELRKSSKDDLDGLLEWMEQTLERLEGLARGVRDDLDFPIGITVAQTAAYLEVTEPTVRKWIQEGLLETIDDRKPIEITQESARKLNIALEQVRQAYPGRQWTKALAVYLHDRDLRRQDWVAQGIDELRRGELVDR